MDPSAFYVAVTRDLVRLVAEGDDYSMLRASALLRQLLMDKSSLIHTVNRRLRIKFRFTVCGRRYTEAVLASNPVFFCALGGIHADGVMAGQSESVKLDELLSFPVLKLGTQVLTVGDLIRICANVMGGVHYGEPQDAKERALAAFQHSVSVGGQTVHAAQLAPIINVVIDGLTPLTQAVVKAAASDSLLR